VRHRQFDKIDEKLQVAADFARMSADQGLRGKIF